jgi:hypothetical protein
MGWLSLIILDGKPHQKGRENQPSARTLFQYFLAHHDVNNPGHQLVQEKRWEK